VDIEPGDGFCYQGDCRSFPQLRRWVDEPGSNPTDTEPRHEDEIYRSITAAELDLLFDKEQDLCKIDRTQSRQSHHDVNKNRQITEERAQELAERRPMSYSVRSNLIRDEREEQKRLDDEGRDRELELATANYYEAQQQREEAAEARFLWLTKAAAEGDSFIFFPHASRLEEERYLNYEHRRREAAEEEKKQPRLSYHERLRRIEAAAAEIERARSPSNQILSLEEEPRLPYQERKRRAIQAAAIERLGSLVRRAITSQIETEEEEKQPRVSYQEYLKQILESAQETADQFNMDDYQRRLKKVLEAAQEEAAEVELPDEALFEERLSQAEAEERRLRRARAHFPVM